MSKATVEIKRDEVFRYRASYNPFSGKTVGGFQGTIRRHNKRSYPPKIVFARTREGVIKKAREWVARMDRYEQSEMETEFFEL